MTRIIKPPAFFTPPHAIRSKRMDQSVRIDGRPVDRIPPDPRTGKFRFIEALPAVTT